MNAGSLGKTTPPHDLVSSDQISFQRLGDVSTIALKLYLYLSTAKNNITHFYLGLVGYQEMVFTFQRNQFN